MNKSADTNTNKHKIHFPGIFLSHIMELSLRSYFLCNSITYNMKLKCLNLMHC